MYWNKILDYNLSKLYENETKLNKFKNFLTNFERVSFLISDNILLNECNTFLKQIYDENASDDKSANFKDSEQKNAKLSSDYRLKGNDYYAKKQTKQAFKCYTLSLLYAPCDFLLKQKNQLNKSEVLALSNRSAIFFNEKLYHECLKDIYLIQDILHNNKNDLHQDVKTDDLNDIFNLIIKLLIREANCFYYLKLIDKLEENLIGQNLFQTILKEKPFSSVKSESKLNETNNLIKNLYDKLKEQISQVDMKKLNLNDRKDIDEIDSKISDCIDIKFSQTKGRHCLANRDINLGECLFIEEPYAAILLPEFTNKYCEYCFKILIEPKDNNLFKLINIQFCQECTTVFYCSSKCKSLAKHSHKYECKITKSILHNLGIAHLAYRIVIKTNIDLIKKYSKLEIDFNEENLINKIDYKKFDDIESNYHQVFSLMTHESNTHIDDLFKYSLTSVLLGQHFVNLLNAEELTNNDFLPMISSLILRHLLQTICNAHAINQLKDDNISNEITFDREQIRYATAIYSRVSLLNHSCDSNILSSFIQDSKKIIIKASRKISNKEEIFNCYGPHHLKMNLFVRQQSLFEQYKFKCDCEACLKQTISINLDANNNELCGLRCLKCKSAEVLVKISDKVNYILKFDNFIMLKCKRCESQFDLKDYTKFFDQVDVQLEKLDFSSSSKSARNLTQVNEYLDKFKSYLLVNDKYELDFRSSSQKINEYFKMFYLNYSKLIDLSSRLNCNLKSFDKASELTKKNICLLEFIYKSTQSNDNTVELAHEFFKLAEIECNCHKFLDALNSVDRAISLAKNVYSEKNNIIDDFIDLRNNIINLLKN